jgi:hypothetical protein
LSILAEEGDEVEIVGREIRIAEGRTGVKKLLLALAAFSAILFIALTAAGAGRPKGLAPRKFDKAKLEKLYRALTAVRVGLDGDVRMFDFERMITAAEVERKLVDEDAATPDEKIFLATADVAILQVKGVMIGAGGFTNATIEGLKSQMISSAKDSFDRLEGLYLGKKLLEKRVQPPLPIGETFDQHKKEGNHEVEITINPKDLEGCSSIETFELDGSYGPGKKWPTAHDRFVSIELTAKEDGANAVLVREASHDLVRAESYRCSAPKP